MEDTKATMPDPSGPAPVQLPSDPQIEAWFTYHSPNSDQQVRYQELRANAKQLWGMEDTKATMPDPSGPAPVQLPSDPQIEAWFTYHSPNSDQQVRYQELRANAKQLAYAIKLCTKPGPDQSAAFRLLRECVMTANASIALEPAS